MKAWLISIVSVCILLILMELMLSEGKTKKFIQGILRLAVVIVLLIPIIKLAAGEIPEISFEEEKTEKTEYNGLSDYIKEKTEETVENELNAMGGVCDVIIIYEKEEIKKVEITIKENGINSEGENIYTNEKIIERVTEIINVDKEKVRVYGAG